MNRWKDVLIRPETTVIDAIKVLDTTALQIVLIIDNSGKLLGTLTDGDIRRAILKGIPLSSPVQEVMNSSFTAVKVTETRGNILRLMREKHLHHVPVLDENQCIVGLELLDELLNPQKRDNLVVLMAGGLGTRLGDLTKKCPKPLLKVGNKPILETIIASCREYGLHNFVISVNYKAEMIEQYCGDGSQWGVSINYIHEYRRLGTAGALGLLTSIPSQPILVMNGDVLTKVNLQHLFDFHDDIGSYATMCVREYDFQVPYGVVTIDKHRLIGIEEKPIHRFFVNAGIYILSPKSIPLIPRGEFFDMPSLFENMLHHKMETSVFPIREYWLDIGKLDDYERAKGEYGEVFE